jgi:FkbM family methyltransferase
VKVMVGGVAAVRMPAEFAGGSWERHEPETVSAFVRWVERHPGALILDIGSSIGIFSAVALFADAGAEVVAFDSDLSSLAALRRLCQHAPGPKPRLVLGFVAQNPTEVRSLDDSAAATEAALEQAGTRGDVGTTRYVCLTDGDNAAIASRRLDDLIRTEDLAGRDVLVKCDVEGAELLVLRGAEKLLRCSAPVLLLSVHPLALPDYGHSRESVEEYLKSLGYEIRILAVDHEEHWWCERAE